MVITAVNNRDAVESTSTMLQRPMQGTRSENLRHVQGQSDLQTVHTYAALQSTHDTTRKMICPTCGKAQAPIVSQANDNVAMHINNSHQTQYATHVKPQCECNWSPSTLHCSLQNHLKAGLKFIGTAVTIVQGINGFGIHSDIRVLLYMEVVSTVMMELHVSELSAFAAKLAVCFEKSLVHCQYALTYVRDNTTTYQWFSDTLMHTAKFVVYFEKSLDHSQCTLAYLHEIVTTYQWLTILHNFASHAHTLCMVLHIICTCLSFVCEKHWPTQSKQCAESVKLFLRGIIDVLQQLQVKVVSGAKQVATSCYTLYVMELCLACSILKWIRQPVSIFYSTPLQWLIVAHLALTLDRVLIDVLHMLIRYASQHMTRLQLQNRKSHRKLSAAHPKHSNGK